MIFDHVRETSWGFFFDLPFIARVATTEYNLYITYATRWYVAKEYADTDITRVLL